MLLATVGVLRLSAQGTPPSVVMATPLSPGQPVAVGSLVWPARVYVGQQATYEVGVFLSDAIRARLRRNPEFVPPELRSILAHDLPMLVGSQARVVDSVRFDVHVFRRALFPLVAGRHDIPPARLNYALPLSGSFFSREESHTLRTSGNVLVALEPPLADRPADFAGAVGRLALDARLDAARGRVGDPLLLTVEVSGTGNVALLPRPLVALPWADAVAGAERVTLDSASALVRGRKAFDFLLTPKQAGAHTVPALRYPYFNPYTEHYEIAVTPALTVAVAPGGAVATPLPVDTTSPLPLRRAWRGAVPLPVSSSAWFWWSLAAVPLLALPGLGRRPLRQPQPGALARLRRLARDEAGDARGVRRAVTDALVERLGLPAALLANRQALVKALRRHGVPDTAARDLGLLLAELDAAVFAPRTGMLPPLPTDVARRAADLLDAVDRGALPAGHAWARRGVVVGTFLSIALLAIGAQAGSARGAFTAGLEAWDRRAFVEARAQFAQAAREEPRAADAWANLGWAAWQQQDTAWAVAGWQRALRLEPAASDVRLFLTGTPGFRNTGLGTAEVPPIPLDALAWSGALLWVGGWSLIAFARGRRVRRPWGVTGVVAATLTALAAVVHGETLSGRHHAVVDAPVTLHREPQLASESAGQGTTGEVVRITAGQGAWSRVRTDDGRLGWIESRHLIPLGEVPRPRS